MKSPLVFLLDVPMPLQFHPDDNDEEDRPLRLPKSRVAPPIEKSILQPRSFSQRSIRAKLYVLFAMLLVVVFAMREAGKPENWRWMGFEDPNTIVVEDDTEQRVVSDGSSSTPSEFKTRSASSLNRGLGSITILNQSSASGSDVATYAIDEIEYPAAAVRFWKEFYGDLESPNRRVLLDAIGHLSRGETNSNRNDSESDYQELLARLAAARSSFHQFLLDEMTLMPDASPDKSGFADQYYECEQIWKEKILPALEARLNGTDITLSQQQAVIQLQVVLDKLALNQVVDRTAFGWAGDSPAWIRLWERLETTADPVTVQRLQLMSQPASYRGQLVEVEGWARAVRWVALGEDSQLGMDGYYELWIRPRETKAGPYCAFVQSLPDGFSPAEESFSTVNHSIKLDGVFFKVRSYVAKDSSVEYAPVLLAKTVRVLDVS